VLTVTLGASPTSLHFAGTCTLSRTNNLSSLKFNRRRPLLSALGSLVWPCDTRLEALPEPRVIIDNLNFSTINIKLATNSTGVLRVSPRLEVDEASLEVRTIVASALNHINAVNISQLELVKDRLHTLPADVREDTRNADAVSSHSF
jgi:hypothetical protein